MADTQEGFGEISEDLIGMWYIDLTGGNFLMSVYKNGAMGALVKARFRWYRDDKTFDSTDEKHGFRTVIPANRDPLEASRELYAKVAEMKPPDGSQWEIIHTEGETLEQFVEKLSRQPGVHVKKVPVH